MGKFGVALLHVTSYFSYKTLYRCRARNTKQSWFSSCSRSPFKNSPFKEKLFANQNTQFFICFSSFILICLHLTGRKNVKRLALDFAIKLFMPGWPLDSKTKYNFAVFLPHSEFILLLFYVYSLFCVYLCGKK